MSDSGTRAMRASAAREVAYPVEHVWAAMATLLPYCEVCDVSAIVDSPGELGLGTAFRAFSGRVVEPSFGSEGGDGSDGGDGGDGRNGGGDDSGEPARGRVVEGGMPGEIVDWSPQRSVATRLETDAETVRVCVDMVAATPDTTLVTISVDITPVLRNRVALAMSRSSYQRMAKRTVEGEIEKLPAHLALLDNGL